MKLFSVLVLITTFIFTVADILVTIPNGTLKGRKEYSLRGLSFYAFQQIPFAKPPIGELRFREPQPAGKWDGILDATYNDKSCIQFSNNYNVNISLYENEDCLYLNVYTPAYPSANLSLPVLYNIYGGAFLNGAANFDYSGPHYLMESDVVVVTVNYRVGPFGFLSTGDNVIPGNYGLKDQQMGLKWVKENIKYFGGDPEKVTIMGQSAGAASVAFQLMSKSSEGLFRGAIAQSGSTIVPWAYQRSHKALAFKLGAALGRSFDESAGSKDLVEFLRTVSAKDLNKAATSIYLDGLYIDQMADGFTFTPVIEPEHETAFITESMYGAIENGRMNRVPLIIGICSEEEFGKTSESGFFEELQRYDNDITLMVSRNMHLNDKNQLRDVAEAIRNIYTNGRLQDNEAAAIRYFSDTAFTRGIIRHAQLQSAFSDVYFYQFSYHGSLGGNNGPFLDGAEKVKHAEDLSYIWAWSNYTGLNNYPKEDILASDRYRTLITNFAKYLNPTPAESELFEGIIWPKVTPDHFQYLNINNTLSIEMNPKGDVYEKWLDIYDKWAVKPYDTF